MSGAPPQPISPPPGAAAQAGSGVRRHHTITATSRTGRNAERNTIDEESQEWNHEDVGDAEWPSAVGSLGEKGGNLHRQASLPTRYNRGMLFFLPRRDDVNAFAISSLSCVLWILIMHLSVQRMALVVVKEALIHLVL